MPRFIIFSAIKSLISTIILILLVSISTVGQQKEAPFNMNDLHDAWGLDSVALKKHMAALPAWNLNRSIKAKGATSFIYINHEVDYGKEFIYDSMINRMVQITVYIPQMHNVALQQMLNSFKKMNENSFFCVSPESIIKQSAINKKFSKIEIMFFDKK